MANKTINRLHCKQPVSVPVVFSDNVSMVRRKFILSSNKKWVNGTIIKYFFIDGSQAQRNVVVQAFQQWKNLGIGLSFSQTNNIEEAIARIGFSIGDGSWSYVGRDNLEIPTSEKTMNFGWDLTANSYGMTTALHEIGHLLGFQHEHQSPFSGIEWNTEAVYNEFSGAPNNWSKEDIDANILSKMPSNQVIGSSWDSKSIMEYEFGQGLVINPVQYKNGIYPPGILSQQDIKGVKSFYPITAKNSSIQLNKSMAIKAKSGKQDDFEFTPDTTKKYTFQTVGVLDTVMVIWEKGEEENHYLAGDDDTGADKNSKIILPLVKDRTYIINVRVIYAANQSGSLIIT